MEVLYSEIIRLSKSPYLSPILLIKKKDRGWCYCLGYQKLNLITVADKFLILVIEELLDELHDTMIFSKLDLKSEYHSIKMREED